MKKLSGELNQSLAEAYPYDVVDDIDEMLVEAIWQELDRQLPREQVRCVVAEIALRFQDATVKTFLSILVHRRALERLRQEYDEIVS